MVMNAGERWHCTNSDCRCEIRVESGGAVPGSNPRCSCGYLMKKSYMTPVLTYQTVLQLDEPSLLHRQPKQE